MTKYRKKPVIIEAKQWFKHGDHHLVEKYNGQVIRDRQCQTCSKDIYDHGAILTLEGWYIVCPDDWIITGIKGEHYPCKPDIFEATYEKIMESDYVAGGTGF